MLKPFDRMNRRRGHRGATGVTTFGVAPLLLTAALLALTCLPALQSGAEEVLNRVVIRVNDRIATLYDYQQRVEDLTNQISNSELPLGERRQRIAQVPEQVFQELFQEMLLLSRADQAGIVFTEAELDEQTARLRESYGIQSDEEFRQALEIQGLTERGFREQMDSGMRIQELLRREVRGQLDVGEELAREYYRDHPEDFTTPQRMNLRDVVVLEDSGLSAEERRQRAEEIRQRRLAGEELESLVEDGVTSGVIDLGWVNARELADELEAVVWDLQLGDVSQPVEGRGGLHVLEVVDRQEEGLRPFNEVADEAENRAGSIAFQDAMETYVEDLERESYVVLEPPAAAEGFRRLGTEAMPVPPAVATSAPPAATTENQVEEEVSADGMEPEALTELEEEGAQPLPDPDAAADTQDVAPNPLGQDPSPADQPPPDRDNDPDGNR